MQRKTAMLISGAVTAFVLMLVVGLVFGASTTPAAAKTSAQSSTVAVPAAVANASSTDVAALQQQVQQDQGVLQQYKDQLTKAYADLQQAYAQIDTLQNANQVKQGRVRGGESNEGRFRGGGFFGGDD